MPLHHLLDQKLSKKYDPSSRIDDVFKGNDITFLTNENGEPVTLFFGGMSFFASSGNTVVV